MKARMPVAAVDPVALARDLIRRPSVTPIDAGALKVLEDALTQLGFACRRMPFEGIENLYARFGTASPNLCFAGHTDVVPVGDLEAWRCDPFEARLEAGELVGRGAVDMKGSIAAFVAAAGAAKGAGEVTGSLSFLITGDEEGRALHGTRAVVEALAAEGEIIDHCLVGEPTSAEVLGDVIKIGRRGSLSAQITVHGVQGHVAYPDRAANPVPVLIRLLYALQQRRLDDGFEGFQPSNLEVTTIDVGNPASNVIPAQASARLNIRFNPSHSGASLGDWIQAEATRAGEGFAGKVEVAMEISGEAFLTKPGPFVELVAEAVGEAAGRRPQLSTSGGTSDARFIRLLCPVVELGLVGTTMHAVDERVPAADIEALAGIYRRVIQRYFEAHSAPVQPQ
jgi:succinyl-diaminopimelate desuccinylase